MQLTHRADTALADFHGELDARFGPPADALHDSCANLKDSYINLRTTVTANSSDLASLTLMGQTHARVSTLEAATAKNEADVATTMTALAATAASHATTAAAVAEFCKTSIRGCNKLLLCITVKLVHKIMRVFYSHCFAFRYACDTQCVASGGMFCHM